MLRIVVALLLIANIGFYAWRQGGLDNLIGLKSQGDREPERMSRQVRPDSLQVLQPAASSPSTSNLAAGPADLPVCLEAGPYTPDQIAAAEGVLQTVLPAGSWTTLKTDVPAVWIVYMGKYPNHEALLKKFDELKRLHVNSEEVHNPPELEGGLSLGRFDSRGAAETALTALAQRGVRTAHVEPLVAATVAHTLRVERADSALQMRLSGLRADSLQGKPFVPCAARS